MSDNFQNKCGLLDAIEDVIKHLQGDKEITSKILRDDAKRAYLNERHMPGTLVKKHVLNMLKFMNIATANGATIDTVMQVNIIVL